MTTQWYYAVEGTSIGPISTVEFDQLVSSGTIRSDTLVWQEGMEDWLPYGRHGQADGAGTPPAARHMANDDPARSDANTFLGALKDGFARYVDFKTRSTRSQFWYWTLWSVLINFATTMFDPAMNGGVIGGLVSLVMFLPSLAVAIRRLHDTGRSGWWYLLVFIPVIGWIALIVFWCNPSQEHENQWGAPPLR